MSVIERMVVAIRKIVLGEMRWLFDISYLFFHEDVSLGFEYVSLFFEDVSLVLERVVVSFWVCCESEIILFPQNGQSP